MVKPEELRIGNWILDHEGAPRKVAYVGDAIGVYNSCGGTQKYQHNPIYSGDIKELKPVPLTPELLWQAGLGDGQDIGGEHTYIREQEGAFYLVCDFVKVANKPIRYLHELQNIHHALTGKELPVNLPA